MKSLFSKKTSQGPYKTTQRATVKGNSARKVVKIDSVTRKDNRDVSQATRTKKVYKNGALVKNKTKLLGNNKSSLL